jgi:hypothetical protein
MALTVRETKAGRRPGGGYPTTFPTRGSHPLKMNSSTVFNRAVLKPGQRQQGQLVGRRGGDGSADRGLAMKLWTIA